MSSLYTAAARSQRNYDSTQLIDAKITLHCMRPFYIFHQKDVKHRESLPGMSSTDDQSGSLTSYDWPERCPASLELSPKHRHKMQLQLTFAIAPPKLHSIPRSYCSAIVLQTRLILVYPRSCVLYYRESESERCAQVK